MSDTFPITKRMQVLVDQWEQATDQRASFLACYLMMTRNMLAAIQEGRFHDCDWVSKLLHYFANYYFEALQAYEQDRAATPAVWLRAHTAAVETGTLTLQKLLLGVNAHINYDLVLTLVDLLDAEWESMQEQIRRERYEDYCHVNQIINETIDSVQDSILEVDMPAMDVIDRLFGGMDEWLISYLISDWREEVWQKALTMLTTHAPNEREQIRQRLEAETLARAEAILLKGNLGAII